MRRFPSLLPTLVVAVAIGAGCGEDTPQGREAASPADRVAAPAPAPGDPDAPDAPDALAPDTGAEDRDPVPRVGAPAAVGEAPERPVTGAVPEPRPDR